jgi:predicted ATPase/DNA-binding CsgD family transcriptional regulator
VRNIQTAVRLHRWRHNLPQQPTLLVGRERELAALAMELQKPSVRLLTLTGVGGTGKTRLAIASAAAWLDGNSGEACFVDLAAIPDPEGVMPAIAAALGVHETPRVAPREAVAQVVRPRLMLLVLDNCEHVLGAAGEVSSLLDQCPYLTVLATSREPLHLRAEREVPVAPLAVPGPGAVFESADDHEALLGWSAIALFVDRAQAVAPSFALTRQNAHVVVDVCARLDGLPLAIELAAAQSRVLDPVSLRARLAGRLDLLRSSQQDVPPRHRTLAEAIRWSYELLPPSEQAVFRRLAVFAGACTLSAVEAVAGDPGTDLLADVSGLVAKSLLQSAEQSDGPRRLRFLETVRAFALDRLVESGEEHAVRARHARYYLEVAEHAEAGMIGSDQDRWFPELEAEQDNFRAAMRWCITENRAEMAVRFGSALTVYWYPRGHFEEGSGWLTEALSMPGADMPTPWRVRALCRTAGLLLFKGEIAAAALHAQAALEQARTISDEDSIGQAMHVTGLVALGRGDWATARTHFTAALEIFRALNDWWWQGWSLDNLGLAAMQLGDTDAAYTAIHEGLQLRRAGSDRWGTAESLERLGELHAARGAHEFARPPLVESLFVRLDLGDRRGLARGLEALAGVDIARGDLIRGTQLMGAAEALRGALGSPLLGPEQGPHERARTVARTRLGLGAFDEAWHAGSSLPLERVLKLAAATEPALRSVGAPSPEASSAQLTTREREIATLIGRGWTSRQIAEALVITVKTADTHADRIRDKLGMHSRAEIAAWAVHAGLVGEDQTRS